MNTVTINKTVPVKAHYDVIVCGGGVAGCAAAVTAAKRGKSVLIIEKSNILGGLATLGLINLFVPMCNGRGKQIIFGLAEKWLRDSARYGYDTIADVWKNGEPLEYTEERYMQRYSPYIFALQLTEEVKDSGADLLFDCIACEMEGASIGQVCTVNGIPFAVIRAISDGGNEDAVMDYPTFVKIAAAKSAAVVRKAVNEMR